MRGERAKRRSKSGARSAARTTRTHKPVRLVAQRGEFDFIEHIRQHAEKHNDKLAAITSSHVPHLSSLLRGIGDDAAVIAQSAGRDTIITADLLVEEIDFRRARTPPAALGHRALAVSLSDIAAMGARPRWALLSVGVPAAIWRTRFLDEFYAGFFALAEAAGVALVGGDVSRAPARIVIDLIVLGETKRGRAVLRSGARAGDQIFVTGTLGGAAAGLRELETSRSARRAGTTKRAQQMNERARTALVARQQRPTPRLAWGALLGERRLASAMLDVSDGLSSDLAHLCRASNVGALIDAARLPVDPHIAAAGFDEADALKLALDGGEDFELLFTVRPRHVARLPRALAGVPVTHIGEVRPPADGIRIRTCGRTRLLKPAGFRHFRRAN